MEETITLIQRKQRALSTMADYIEFQTNFSKTFCQLIGKI